jgi:hypothetical protein
LCIAQSSGIRELKIGGNSDFHAACTVDQFEIKLFFDVESFGTVFEILPDEQAARLVAWQELLPARTLFREQNERWTM